MYIRYEMNYTTSTHSVIIHRYKHIKAVYAKTKQSLAAELQPKQSLVRIVVFAGKQCVYRTYRRMCFHY